MNEREHYDAIVVGGGFFGCSLALHLRRKLGLEVAVLEMGPAPMERASYARSKISPRASSAPTFCCTARPDCELTTLHDSDSAIASVLSVLPPSTTITSSAPARHDVWTARTMFAASFNAGMITEIFMTVRFHCNEQHSDKLERVLP